MAETEKKQSFKILKVYVKDISFESPRTPEIFSRGEETIPKSKIDLNWETTKVAETAYEVVLNVTVTAASNDETVYLAEVQQAGLFHVDGLPNEELKPLLGVYCPGILFPFARQVVSDLISKGGFPVVLLKPVDFGRLYEQNQQELAKQNANSSVD